MATLLDHIAAYEENADYDEVDSVAKAKAFRTACRRILAKQPTTTIKGGGGAQVTMDTRLIAEQLAEVETWLARNPDTEADALHGNSSVIHPDFTNFRY